MSAIHYNHPKSWVWVVEAGVVQGLTSHMDVDLQINQNCAYRHSPGEEIQYIKQQKGLLVSAK